MAPQRLNDILFNRLVEKVFLSSGFINASTFLKCRESLNPRRKTYKLESTQKTISS